MRRAERSLLIPPLMMIDFYQNKNSLLICTAREVDRPMNKEEYTFILRLFG